MYRSKTASSSAHSAVARSSVSKSTCTHGQGRLRDGTLYPGGDTLYRVGRTLRLREGAVRSTSVIPSRREHQFPCCHGAETNGAGERSFRDNRVPYDRGLGQPQSVLSLLAVAHHVLPRPFFQGLLRHADVVARASVRCTFLPFPQLRLQEIDDVPRKARSAGKLAQKQNIEDT